MEESIEESSHIVIHVRALRADSLLIGRQKLFVVGLGARIPAHRVLQMSVKWKKFP